MDKYFLDIWYYIKWVKASCMHSIYIHNFIKLKFQAGKDLGLCWLNAVCLIVTVHPMFHTKKWNTSFGSFMGTQWTKIQIQMKDL